MMQRAFKPGPATSDLWETFMTSLTSRRGWRVRNAALATIALCASPPAAFAADVAPTPQGVQTLTNVLTTYFGKAVADAATVAPEGDHYKVSVDFSKLIPPAAQPDFSLTSAPAKFNLTEQSDGAWKVSSDVFPAFDGHGKDVSFAVGADGYAFQGVYDPALAGFRSFDGKADKIAASIHTPQVDEVISYDSGKFSGSGAAAANGGYSAKVHESFDGASVLITPKKTDQPPAAPIGFQFGSLSLDLAADGVKSHELLDLWRFLVAHPSRAALAADQDTLKTKLRALAPLEGKFDENVAAQNISVMTPKGPTKLDGLKVSFAGQGFPSKDPFEIHLALNGLTPPPGLVPPPFQQLTPTAVDLGVRYSGYDYGAAVQEAIDDIHLEGEGPIISPADNQKIAAKMSASGIIDVTILPSHIVAPQLDVSFEGTIQIAAGAPIGKVTVKARNFDQTIAAVKAAGPMATPQMIGGLALVKGLGKADGDALVWVAEYSADGGLKVNGLPLGKPPAQKP
jgi:hypothetical protein